MILFALSAAMLLATAAVIVRRFPDNLAMRFWGCLAAVNLLLTSAHLLSSVFHALTPLGFLLAQAVCTVGVVATMLPLARHTRVPTPGPPDLMPRLRSWPGWRSPVTVLLLIAVAAACGLSLAEQMLRPVTGFDERMYNCSRVLYWIQHRCIWPWETHNNAQIDFPIGSEVFFSWPLLFTKTEWPARLVYWLGLPALVGGVYTLTRLMQGSRALSLAAALVIATTPTIAYASGVNQKQDLWTGAMFIGATYWLIHGWTRRERLSALLAGLFLVLAMNVKITCVVIAPLTALSLITGWREAVWRAIRERIGLCTAGAVAGLALSGLGITVGQNLLAYGKPFGPSVAAKALSPEWSVRQAYIHAIRTGLFLAEFPILPAEPLRRNWEAAGNEVMYRLDAHQGLPLEKRGAWPGEFRFDAENLAYRYGLGGMVWLLALPWAMVSPLRRLITLPRGPPLSPTALAIIISATQLAALVFLIKWMGGAPDRYWIAPYAVGLPAAMVVADRIARSRRVLIALGLIAVGLAAYAGPRTSLVRLDLLRSHPIVVDQTDEPFTEIISKLPPGAKVLLFCHRNSRDYPLFLPRAGYVNHVTPWGRARFDPERLERMVHEHGITHAVFEAADRVGFHWYPGLRLTFMVEWFRTRPNFREVPLVNPRQRLFERIPGQ